MDEHDHDAARRRALASLSGRIGAYALHAKHDPRVTTAKARQAFLDGFAQRVDPDGVLPPEERARRAAAARKEHFARPGRRCSTMSTTRRTCASPS